MFNPFKRFPVDPSSKRFYKGFLRLSDKSVFKIYSQEKGDPDVPGISGFDSVVRLNSTYLELVDRSYNWRGTWTLAGVIFFSLFFGLFCYSIIGLVLGWGGRSFGVWFAVILTWVITLPISLLTYRMMTSEVFFSTYYPIRFNRKNGMVYVYQSGGTVLSVPWQELSFVLTSAKMRFSTQWTIVGCTTEEDGDTVAKAIPLPINLESDPDVLTMYWEFIRCYMEEGDEYLPDLADSIAWCPPVEKQKEGWLFGLLYLSKQWFGRLGLLVNALQLPFFFVISFPRWLVMLTCKIPEWPAEIAAACQPDENDPVNKGAEHNPPQVWRPMLGLQGKERYARTFAKERGAMDRVVARLKAKYGGQNHAD
ncbi:hypothetical protein EAG21025_41650 [Enterobacter asburiae]|uniref:DUF6708 domain-containing protein n=1 Tax=Enterobacter asburiae TaxID=61645 RepID=UPI0034E866F1|nr:hypothetical protein [Enterobacter asburiae]